jgi:hypothetical protein
LRLLRLPSRLGRFRRLYVFNLASGDIDGQLRQLGGIARALEAAFGHGGNVACATLI